MYNTAMKRLIAPLSSLILVVYAAHAEWLDEATIKAAAEAFPARDLGGFSYGTKVTATGSMLYLGVIRQAGPQGFYRLIVSEK